MTSPPPPHLERLNEAQYDAVTHTDGPLLILAGAGSGKTRVLTRRIAHLLHIGVEVDQLLAVTFTNKAATEMRERVAELVGEVGHKVWVSTFHSSCCRILRAEAEALGYTRRFSIYDDDDQVRLVRAILKEFGYDPKQVKPGELLSKIDHHKNAMTTVEQLVRQHRVHATDPLVRVWRAYEEALKASDAMDFNDLIGNAVRLFQDHDAILEKYRNQLRYVMVDEYQDTNKAQYDLLRLLTASHQNLAVVGDDDQSIYAFRGADVSNILNFERDYPGAKIVRMEQNYRCSGNILSLANAVVAKNTERIDKKLWTEGEHGHKVGFLVHDHATAEARAIGKTVVALQRRGFAAKDMAVIYRTNAASQPFEAAFRELGIHYRVVGGRAFYTRREIRDTLAYVRLLANPVDDAAFLRVCNVPARGVGTATLAKLREEASRRGEPLLKTAKSLSRGTDRGAKALAAFVTLVEGLTDKAQTASLPATLQNVLEDSGYAEMLREEDSKESKQRLENLNHLLRDAAQYTPELTDLAGEALEFEPTPMEALHGWLDQIALAGTQDEEPEGGEVTLMTVHASKGLEYPVIFVVGMVEGQFPHQRSVEISGGISEERRLAYVAFTRAKQRLYVSRVKNLTRFDPKTRKRVEHAVAPSRFLFGLPVDAIMGSLPTAMDNEEPDEVIERFDVETYQRVVRRHQRRSNGRSHAALPDDHVKREITSREDLVPGATIFHDNFGIGELRQTQLDVHPPWIEGKFSSGLRRIRLPTRQLWLLDLR